MREEVFKTNELLGLQIEFWSYPERVVSIQVIPNSKCIVISRKFNGVFNCYLFLPSAFWLKKVKARKQNMILMIILFGLVILKNNHILIGDKGMITL